MKSAIAEHIKGYLLPALHPVVDARVEEGIRTYGQTLDDNVKPERAKAVHQLQELLDAMGYRRWRSTDTVGERPGTPELADLAERRQELDLAHLAGMANEIIQEFPDLTLDEMLFREGHSGAEHREATPAGEALELLRIIDHDLAPENDHPTRHIGGNPYDLLRRAATIIRAQAEALERLEGMVDRWDAERLQLSPLIDRNYVNGKSDGLAGCARDIRRVIIASTEGEAKAEQATGPLIQAGTLGHRLLSVLDELRPDSGAVAALQLACMPDYHPNNTAQALEGMRDLGLVTLLIEHSEAYTVRMTDAGRAALAAAGGEA